MTDDLEMLPHDIAAEQAVLGAMMSDADVLARCLEMLTIAAFYRPAHQEIFTALASLADKGSPADWLTVASEMERLGTLARAGGALYLNDCLHAVPAAVNGPWYAMRLLDHQSRRDTLIASARIGQIGTDPGLSPEERADAAREALDVLTQVPSSGPRTMAELLADAIEALDKGGDRGLPTGFADLDALTGGFGPGELVIVAGRPGMGKSLAVGGMARHVALKKGLPVLLASLEMSGQEVTLRMIAATGRVPLHALVTRQLEQDDWLRINEAAQDLADCPLLIDDTPGMTLATLRSRLRAMARTDPARMLVVDYIGLLGTPEAENRQNAVAGLSRGLKLIAREYGIPVVVAAQLNRRPEGRGDRRPQMSDLRDSGAQEQDADIVILLNRDDYYEAESPRAGEIDLIVDKNRQGPKATITCAFQAHYGRIADMAPLFREDKPEAADEPGWSPSSVLGESA